MRPKFRKLGMIASPFLLTANCAVPTNLYENRSEVSAEFVCANLVPPTALGRAIAEAHDEHRFVWLINSAEDGLANGQFTISTGIISISQWGKTVNVQLYLKMDATSDDIENTRAEFQGIFPSISGTLLANDCTPVVL